MKKYERVISLLKGVLIAYIITVVMLLVMTFLLQKFDLSEVVVEIGILVCYVVSSLIAGMCYAINAKSRKFEKMSRKENYFLLFSWSILYQETWSRWLNILQNHNVSDYMVLYLQICHHLFYNLIESTLGFFCCCFLSL